ncbi:MAG: corrinoid protein [Thermodesulfobacteriota bacterium]
MTRNSDEHLQAIKEAIIEGRHMEIVDLISRAVTDRVDQNIIINDAMIAAMDTVGRMFAENRIFVPEMLVSAMTMKKGLDFIKPLLKDQNSESRGTVIMCTVKGDIHDIGKNLVSMMLEGAGFTVIDLGVDSNIETLIDEVKKIRPRILGLSALLTTTMPEMKHVIQTLKTEGLRDKLKVMVGGAPVDAVFAREIGADGYGRDALEAVQTARRLASAD